MPTMPISGSARTWGTVVVFLLAHLASACAESHAEPHSPHPDDDVLRYVPDATAANDLHLPPPPFTEGAFPCSDCHDPELPVRTRRRELKWAHKEIELTHDEEHRWCLDCHDAENRDVLHLANGTPVAFEESHLLCGQCHGDKHRDWRAGVHGRRTGSWNGEKSYLLCVHCHDAHSPAFEAIRPEPPPPRPRRTP